MHEMSLCQNIMEIIDQQQKKHEIHEVTDIWLEIGALSCVEQSAVEFCFELCAKIPLLKIANYILFIYLRQHGAGNVKGSRD